MSQKTNYGFFPVRAGFEEWTPPLRNTIEKLTDVFQARFLNLASFSTIEKRTERKIWRGMKINEAPLIQKLKRVKKKIYRIEENWGILKGFEIDKL